MARLAPVSEEPVIDDGDSKNRSRRGRSIHNWLKSHMIPAIRFNKNPDLKILLSVLGCPLSPVAVVPKQPRDVASSAQYIIQQFWATSGCSKLGGAAKSMYATGKVRMEMTTREHGLHSSGAAVASKGSGSMTHTGCFVMWQLIPNMWLFELAVSGYKIGAGSDGKVAWRRTPWLGAHTARGIVRPLRRALQGLDPLTIGAVFSRAHHIGEKHIGDEECFLLEIAVDSGTLSSWSDSSAEIIRHRMLGFFSQRSGLLVRLEDCQLTRMHSPGAEAMYWETSTASCIEDYRPVDSVMIAHSGRSTVSMLRFGIGAPVVKQMEETWTIDDIQFNVQGLSDATFIPPEDVQKSCLTL